MSASLTLKRILDLGGAGVGLIILAMPMFLIALFIRFFKGAPVFYKQMRPGLNEKPFLLYKYRTMDNLHSSTGELLPDEERLTSFGRLLRSTSVDELPELLNVLKGNMSLVGPRPLLMEYLELYSAEQMRRHEMKPGVTGWAQVNGRNAISWEEKFKLDVWYVDNWSIWLDFKIILLTILKTVKHEDISANGHATMPEFKGDKND